MRKFSGKLLLFLCCAGIALAPGMPNPQAVSGGGYSFILYDLNQIESAGCLENYILAVRELINGKREKVRIVHIGDSHIQADYLTHSTRINLQKAYGNGGRGFIFPYGIIRSNSPGNVRVRYTGNWEGCRSTSFKSACNFGISGASATTYDSVSSLFINPNKLGEMYYDFNRVDLFHFGNPDEFDVEILSGDSIAGESDLLKRSRTVSSLYLPQFQDSLWLRFVRSSPEKSYYQLFGLSLESPHPGLVYHSIGLNGAHAQSYLRNQFFDEQLGFLAPDLVIISLGTNDGYMPGSRFCKGCFKDNYAAVIRKIRKQNPTASILLTTPGDYYRRLRYHDKHQNDVLAAIRELSEEYHCALWDFNLIMGGKYSIRTWLKNGLANSDQVHYTKEGYQVQGELLFEALFNAESGYGDPDILAGERSETSQ